MRIWQSPGSRIHKGLADHRAPTEPFHDLKGVVGERRTQSNQVTRRSGVAGPAPKCFLVGGPTSRLYAQDVIRPVFQLSAFDHAREPWELLLSVLHPAQITDLWRIGASEVLARHQHGNARRIG